MRRRVRSGLSAVGDPPMWAEPLTGGSGGQVGEVATPAVYGSGGTSAFRVKAEADALLGQPGGFEGLGSTSRPSAAASHPLAEPLDRGVLLTVLGTLLPKLGPQPTEGLTLCR